MALTYKEYTLNEETVEEVSADLKKYLDGVDIERHSVLRMSLPWRNCCSKSWRAVAEICRSKSASASISGADSFASAISVNLLIPLNQIKMIGLTR